MGESLIEQKVLFDVLFYLKMYLNEKVVYKYQNIKDK